MKKSVGRPSSYNTELGEKICALIMEGWTLRQIGNHEEMPDKSTICRWLASGNKEFQEQYASAKAFQADMMAEDILDISDDAANDYYKDDDGVEKLDKESILRSRLRVDSRKWLMSKMLPKKYGDRITHAGDENAPLNIVIGVGENEDDKDL